MSNLVRMLLEIAFDLFKAAGVISFPLLVALALRIESAVTSVIVHAFGVVISVGFLYWFMLLDYPLKDFIIHVLYTCCHFSLAIGYVIMYHVNKRLEKAK